GRCAFLLLARTLAPSVRSAGSPTGARGSEYGTRALARFVIRSHGTRDRLGRISVRTLKRRERRAPGAVQVRYAFEQDSLILQIPACIARRSGQLQNILDVRCRDSEVRKRLLELRLLLLVRWKFL